MYGKFSQPLTAINQKSLPFTKDDHKLETTDITQIPIKGMTKHKKLSSSILQPDHHQLSIIEERSASIQKKEQPTSNSHAAFLRNFRTSKNL